MTSTLLSPQSLARKNTFGEPKLQTDTEVLLVFSGKDGSLYSVEENGVLRKWNPETGSQVGWFSLSDMETHWAASADGRVLASASDDLTFWDVSSGQMLTAIPQPGWVTALAFHPDPGFIAVGYDDGMIHYWDAPGHHAVFEAGLSFHKRAISAIAISPDGKLLAAAGEDKTVSVWNLADGKLHGMLAGHSDRVPALAWHPNSQWLVSAGWDTTARVWDVKSLLPIVLLNSHASQVNAIAFSRDGKRLACADSSMTIHLWDFDNRKTLHKLKGPELDIRSVAFSPDGKHLACNGDRVIHLWNTATGQPSIDVGRASVARTTVSLQKDGARLLSNGGGIAARMWNALSRQLVTTLDTQVPIRALAFSPDGKWIAGAIDNKIRLWNADGKFVADWSGPDEDITTLAFSPDSTTLASGSSQGFGVWLWRVADGEPILLIPDALDGCSIETLAFHPDNNILAVGGIDWMATGGSNGAICLWNRADRCEVASFFEGTTAVAFHPSGQRLAATTLDQSILLWDLDKDQPQNELVGHEGPIACLAYSPDGLWLASGSADHSLRIWNADGTERAHLDVESQVTALAFSNDGQYLYAGHANTTCSQIQLPEMFRRK